MQRTERAALARLVNHLGADITLSHPRVSPLPRRERVRVLANLDDGLMLSMPADWSHLPVTILVAANAEEQRVHRFGVGRPAVMLRQALSHAGLHADQFAMLEGDGTHEMWQAVAAVDSPYLLCVGADALGCWRHDVRLQQVAGGLFPAKTPAGNRLLAAIPQPEAVLRGSFDAIAWRQQIATFVAKVLDDRWTDDITFGCRHWDRARETTCGEPVHGWDRLGLPWCRKHLVEGWDGAAKAESKRTTGMNRSLQEGLPL